MPKKVKTKNRKKTRAMDIKPIMNLVDINSIISILTLNINGLTAPMKRQIFRVHRKTQLYVLYKKSALNIKTHIDKT